MTTTPFNETLTAERTPLFTLSSVHPLSQLRNVITGTPSHTNEEYELTAGDKLESAEIARYVPGFAAEAGIGVRVGTLPTGSQVMRWGLYDDEDGFFYELDATGLSVVVRRNSVDTKVTQANWNVDPLSGGDPDNDTTLDVERGNIFQVLFTWYGYGQANFQIVDTRQGLPGEQRVTTVHRWSPDGSTSVRNPNLPVTAEVTGAGDGVLYVGGRQFSVVGKYVPATRTHSTTRATVTGVGTSWTPLIAFRRKDNDDAKRIKLRVEGMKVLVTANTQVALVENPTVTFGTAIAPDLTSATFTAVEFSINPSGYSLGVGEPLIVDLIDSAGAGGNRSGADRWASLNVPVARQRPVVLLARALTGTTDVTALLRVLEEW